MWENLDVALEKVSVENLKEKPSSENLCFGSDFTDHMFAMTWSRENGWHDAKICPYHNLVLDPAAMVFHYGQAIFEGMKGYKGKDGQTYMFRPTDNLERMNQSAVRLCMPRLPVDKVLKSLKALLYLEKDWIPEAPGSSLYIRPTMIAVEPSLGVRPSEKYYFFVIMSPVGAYYKEGCNPTKIYVSDEQARAVPGGVGNIKTAGNYAASLYTAEIARKKGCSQVLWLDAKEFKYVEEVGTSNIFFRIGDELITPPLGGSILGGITRDSILKLARSWGLNVSERKITIEEVLRASEDGTLLESFGTGTAAVISPVGEIVYKDKSYIINAGKAGELSQRLYAELQGIQYGELEDPFKWVERVG
ncbi:branched-chain amino acid aminotransferase [Desulfotalea psychrophila]|uniref:Branched-chain-amino-acid aminotransferase n=1 Tax=Desulfotalea psychrophila (strain LSv54 / DSM 12343) TaxID=177439 RepID=Q6ARV4_DESPS|nr:branched-chain amino acid aminotransferase [Desulfotalea psychrophila]CAG34921.1 probable branched-chain amino acid aminotransferase [Desulfotalea psychrophila LSv54]